MDATLLLEQLDAIGIQVALASWLPTPTMLIPSRGLALIDGRLSDEAAEEALASILSSALDRLLIA